jgi:hypothetical protein
MEPIGQLLRKQSAATKKTNTGIASNKPKTLLSLEEQIKSLESELGSDGSASDDRHSQASDDLSDGASEEGDAGIDLEVDESGNVVKIGTKLSEDDLIKPLPKKLLPLPMYTKILKNAGLTPEERAQRKSTIRFADEQEADGDGKRKKKKIDGDQQQKKAQLAGLETTIREQLANYRPASVDKLPFYCRCCSHQSANIEEFEAHRKSEEHKVGLAVEKRMSFCKLCRKQFTSPDQLKGHLDGKAHKERLEYMKQKQQGGRRFR